MSLSLDCLEQETVMNEDEKLVQCASSFMWLLFEEKGELPKRELWAEKLNEFGYEVHISEETNNNGAEVFHLPRYTVDLDDAKNVPYGLMAMDFLPVTKAHGDSAARTQFWQTPNGIELLDSCRWQVLVGDIMSFTFPAKTRAHILYDWLEIALDLLPTCKGVFFESSQNVMTAQSLRENPYEGAERFFHGAVNARLFTVEDTPNMLVDTLGLHVLGIPDVQFYFHALNPNAIVNQAYNIGMYQLEYDVPIRNGETVDGLDEDGSTRQDIQWKCRYQVSLLEPHRDVLDVEAGEYAAGKKH